MDHMDHMDAVMQKSPFCPSGPPGPSMTNALFPARVDGSWGRGKLLFTRKEVFPFPKPQPFSRKAKYFIWGTVFTAVSVQALREEFSN